MIHNPKDIAKLAWLKSEAEKAEEGSTARKTLERMYWNLRYNIENPDEPILILKNGDIL